MLLNAAVGQTECPFCRLNPRPTQNYKNKQKTKTIRHKHVCKVNQVEFWLNYGETKISLIPTHFRSSVNVSANLY